MARLFIETDVGAGTTLKVEAEAVADIFHHLVMYMYEMVMICRKTGQLSALR